MLYDYGPLRFSFTRGLVLTVVVPLLIAIGLGGLYAHLNDVPLQEGIQHVARSLADLYRQYPAAALAFHLAFFLRGLAYRRRYTNWGAHLLFLGAAGAFAYYGYARIVHPEQTPPLASVPDDIVNAATSIFSPPNSTRSAAPAAPQTGALSLPAVPGVNYRANDLAAASAGSNEGILVAQDAEGLLTVDAAVGPRRVRFVVDRTSDVTTLPFSYAADFGAAKCDKVQLSSVSGVSEGCAFRIPVVLIGRFTVRDVDVVFVDTTEKTAYLGQNVLQRFRLESVGTSVRLSLK